MDIWQSTTVAPCAVYQACIGPLVVLRFRYVEGEMQGGQDL